MSVKWSLRSLIDKKYADLSPQELLDVPVSAIKGVSERDAELLKQAFNIKTIRDLADNKYVKIAQAITSLADFWEEALDKAFEKKSPKELVNAPVSAISGVSERDAELLKQAFNIKTVKDFATQKYILIAQIIKTLAILQPLIEEAAREAMKEEAKKTEEKETK